MKVNLNDEVILVNENSKISDIVKKVLDGNYNGIALALNNKIIPKEKWDDFFLKENDCILIIHATKGG